MRSTLTRRILLALAAISVLALSWSTRGARAVQSCGAGCCADQHCSGGICVASTYTKCIGGEWCGLACCTEDCPVNG